MISLGPADQPKEAEIQLRGLSTGDYLVKVFLDNDDEIVADPTRFLDEEDFMGQVEFLNAKWQVGFFKS